MTHRRTLTSHDFRIPRRSGDGQGIGARAPHRGQLGRFHLENLSIVLGEDRLDAETAHPPQQNSLRLSRGLPAAPGAVQGGIENAVGRDSPAARRRPQDRQAAAQARRPAQRPLSPGPTGPREERGLGHLFTVRATPYQTVESEGRGDSGQGPADRTTGGEQSAGRAGHSQEGLRLSPRRTSDAMPRARTHHSIGEAAMSPGRRKASSHIWTRGESPRTVRSNLLSTRRRDSDGGSPIASLPELSGSLKERSRGCE